MLTCENLIGKGFVILSILFFNPLLYLYCLTSLRPDPAHPPSGVTVTQNSGLVYPNPSQQPPAYLPAQLPAFPAPTNGLAPFKPQVDIHPAIPAFPAQTNGLAPFKPHGYTPSYTCLPRTHQWTRPLQTPGITNIFNKNFIIIRGIFLVQLFKINFPVCVSVYILTKPKTPAIPADCFNSFNPHGLSRGFSLDWTRRYICRLFVPS